MFAQGSRYRRVPESAHPNARGELVLSKEIRAIPTPEGRFLHTVRERDRLDLLAYKYYVDPTRWWQIADANPQVEFPLDLVDRAPVVDEAIAFSHAGYVARVDALIAALGALGPTTREHEDLLSLTLTFRYTTEAVRAQAVAAMAAAGFSVQSSSPWPDAGGTREAFVLVDPAIAAAWNTVVRVLRSVPGVLDLESAIDPPAVRLAYNQHMTSGEAIRRAAAVHGFEPIPERSMILERPGAAIVIPPNQPV